MRVTLLALGLVAGCAGAARPPPLAPGVAAALDLRCDGPTDVAIDAPSNARVVVHVGEPLAFEVSACAANGMCTRPWPMQKDFELVELFRARRLALLRFVPRAGCAPGRTTLSYDWLIVD